MAELSPYPLRGLLSRALEELDRNGSIFDLPARHFSFDPVSIDTSVRIHGRSATSPLGPSAGPHSQMAQNIVLCWLAGARVFELKTVQLNDRIRVPRPCIEVRGAGLNVEWSQELTLEQSLDEYVKAAMLIEVLAAQFGVAPGCLFDVSVGYDLAGIRSERMVGFLRDMLYARTTVDRLRQELPPGWRDLDFPGAIATSVTVSTFHGCPVSEIRAIAEFLMAEVGLDCTIKLNPTLLGSAELLDILHDRLGYTHLRVPASAFEKDPQWNEAVDIVGRLQQRAMDLGRSFAVKLTNTLVVENSSDFLPQSEKLAYLSGPPLHVLAMHLVARFRDTFGRALPISFSAGINRRNYPDAVALGLAPVTVCTDLLKSGGYSRLHGYRTELQQRMEAAGARSMDAFATADVHSYLDALDSDPRYRYQYVQRATPKTGRPLELFDCSTCDLCIAACPNDALMRLPSIDGPIPFARRHQIANFADFCNDCGNCEIVCPDDGAPQREKLRFFGSREAWQRHAPLDGFWVGPDATLARIDGVECADASHPLVQYARNAVLDRHHINYINTLAGENA